MATTKAVRFTSLHTRMTTVALRKDTSGLLSLQCWVRELTQCRVQYRNWKNIMHRAQL